MLPNFKFESIVIDLTSKSWMTVYNTSPQAKGKKRQIGWFPASYVKPLGGGSASARSTPVFQEATNILDAPPSQTPPSNTANKTISSSPANGASPATVTNGSAAPAKNVGEWICFFFFFLRDFIFKKTLF